MSNENNCFRGNSFPENYTLINTFIGTSEGSRIKRYYPLDLKNKIQKRTLY